MLKEDQNMNTKMIDYILKFISKIITKILKQVIHFLIDI